MSQQQFSSPESRLDAETVKRVIDRAATLQQAHLETVSPDQLEALASEVGIDPEFVKRALGEIETEPVAEMKTVRRIVRRKVARKKTEIAGLTARQVRTALTPGAIYALFAFFVMLNFNGYNGGRTGAEIVFLLLQPAILTVYFAQRQPHRRMGALLGLSLGLLPILAAAIPSDGRGVPVFAGLFYGPMLAALGFGATAARKWLDERNAEEVIEEIVREPAR